MNLPGIPPAACGPMSYATAREAVAKASLRPHAAGGIPGRFIAHGETRIGF